MSEPILSGSAPVGAVETLSRLGALISAVFAMQPSDGTRLEERRPASAPFRDRSSELDTDAKRTVREALAAHNEKG